MKQKIEIVERIITDLSEAIEYKDCYVPKNKIRKCVEKNYSEMKNWTFANFFDFASDLSSNDGNWKATCSEYDLL